MNIDNNFSRRITFRAGLNTKILLREQMVNVKQQEKMWHESLGVETRFLDNKAGALANLFCLNIFDKLSSKLKLNLFLPPSIYLYKAEEKIDTNAPSNFCISDTQRVLKNEYPFAGRALFFKNFENLKNVDDLSEKMFSNKISSSPHFLAPFIHEWLHSLQLHYIYTKFGYGGSCMYMNEVYPPQETNKSGVELIKELETKKLSEKENEILFDNLGEYSTQPMNQYLEVFSEAFTKLICKSLRNGVLVKNPFDELNNMGQDFQDILKKVCLFK